jgi:hypothetical protein
MRKIRNFIAVALLVSSTGYFGAMAVESGHQDRHINQIESKW